MSPVTKLSRPPGGSPRWSAASCVAHAAGPRAGIYPFAGPPFHSSGVQPLAPGARGAVITPASEAGVVERSQHLLHTAHQAVAARAAASAGTALDTRALLSVLTAMRHGLSPPPGACRARARGTVLALDLSERRALFAVVFRAAIAVFLTFSFLALSARGGGGPFGAAPRLFGATRCARRVRCAPLRAGRRLLREVLGHFGSASPLLFGFIRLRARLVLASWEYPSPFYCLIWLYLDAEVLVLPPVFLPQDCFCWPPTTSSANARPPVSQFLRFVLVWPVPREVSVIPRAVFLACFYKSIYRRLGNTPPRSTV